MPENSEERPPGVAPDASLNINRETSQDTSPARPQILSAPSKTTDSQTTWRADHGLPRPDRPLPNPSSRSRRSQARPSPQRPHYSLAGNFTAQAHAPSYVDPRYYELNPRYQKPENSPVWGLAKPLPRVVRPGMRRGQNGDEKAKDEDVVENTKEEVPEPGSAEAIPQVGMIGDQRQEEGKETPGRVRRNNEKRGYGHQKIGRKRSNRVSRAGSASSAGSYATPMDERGDPMEEWIAKQPSNTVDPFDDQYGHLGSRRTTNFACVQEAPSRVVSRDFAERSDQSHIDLEAQYPDEWPLEKEEADQYAQEEWEMHNGWASFRARFREPLAECLATMVAVLIGLCTNLAVQTSNNTAGSYQSQNWAWGLGVTIGVYLAGGISGGHLNPVISLTLSLYRGFPIRKALIYTAAQLLGGLFAGLIAYGLYRDAIISYNSAGGLVAAQGGSSAPVGLFEGGTGKALFTQPAPFEGVGAAFANEFVATAILVCAILALGDDSNAPPGAGMHAFIVGLVVFVLTMAFGYTTGACLNPARDFGPRVAATIVGYGGRVFTDWNAWWIYGAWGATISGGLVGGLFYDAAIFVGGESPINYPRGKRRRAKDKVKNRWWYLKSDVKKKIEAREENDSGKEG